MDPSARPSFDSVLHTSRGKLFPECFYTTFHDFISSINDISISTPFYNTSNTSGGGATPVQARPQTLDEKSSVTDDPQEGSNALPVDSDRRITRIWSEFDVVEPCFTDNAGMGMSTIKVDYTTQYTSFKPIQVHTLIPLETNAKGSPTATEHNSGGPLHVKLAEPNIIFTELC